MYYYNATRTLLSIRVVITKKKSYKMIVSFRNSLKKWILNIDKNLKKSRAISKSKMFANDI